MLHPFIEAVLQAKRPYALVEGDALTVLCCLPSETVDCVFTSPPYWQQRSYQISGEAQSFLLGEEADPQEYIRGLGQVFYEIKRILKPTGSLWINLGDKYEDKNLLGLPWRLAFALQDQGWILRNDIIWEKQKGTEPVKDRLRHNHEHIFHFVKQKKYYYNADAIRRPHRHQPTIANQKTISATGVSGKKYREQILKSGQLTEAEKISALQALDQTLERIRTGEIVDFRMTIRGYQRTLHGNQERYSGRARELDEKGFFILYSDAKGYVPSDVWHLVPEDKVKERDADHYAVFPPNLLRLPLMASCPPEGIVLDPFAGVASTLVAASRLGYRSIGIELSKDYVQSGLSRLAQVYGPLFT